MPELSVIMSAFNSQETLPEAIESVLGQSFDDYEFIIVNDGSTDETGEIIAEYQSRDSRISFINQSNRGLTESLNTALSCANGEFIARQDSDDYSYPRRLEITRAFLRNNKEHVLVGTDWEFVDERSGNTVSIRNSRRRRLPKRLQMSNQFAHGSIMFRAVVGGERIFYNRYYRRAQDYDLVLRLSEMGRIAIIPPVLYRMRFLNSGISASKSNFYGEIARENFRRRKDDKDEIFPEPSENEENGVAVGARLAPYEYGMGLRYLSGYEVALARNEFLSVSKNEGYDAKVRRKAYLMGAYSLLPVWLLKAIREL